MSVCPYINGASSARALEVSVSHTLHTIYTNSGIFQIVFWLIGALWMFKNMYSSRKIYNWYFHTLSLTLHILYTHFGLYWPIFDQFQNSWCLKACSQAGKLKGDTSTHSHILLHTLWHNFHTLYTHSRLIRLISKCWVSKSMYSSWELRWYEFHTTLHIHTHTHSSKTLSNFLPICALRSNSSISCLIGFPF